MKPYFVNFINGSLSFRHSYEVTISRCNLPDHHPTSPNNPSHHLTTARCRRPFLGRYLSAMLSRSRMLIWPQNKFWRRGLIRQRWWRIFNAGNTPGPWYGHLWPSQASTGRLTALQVHPPQRWKCTSNPCPTFQNFRPTAHPNIQCEYIFYPLGIFYIYMYPKWEASFTLPGFNTFTDKMAEIPKPLLIWSCII